MSDVKNIVVIGGGYAGADLAKRLDQSVGSNYRVILIEKKSHFYHNIASLRAAVEDIDDRIFIPYSGLFKNNGLFVQATVTAIHKNEVHINPAHETLGANIAFDYAVIATGSEYSQPAKLHSNTKEENVKHLKQTRDAVKAAQKILIIGGGSVGVELAGEIKTAYPEKDVTIIHSGSTLVSATPFSSKFKNKLYNSTKALGINIVLDEKVIWDDNNIGRDFSARTIKTESGKEYASDLQFVAFGVKPNGGIIESLDSSLLNPETHSIKVKPTLQLDGADYPHIYAIGDAADIKGEAKMAYKAGKQSELVAKNIQASIAGTPQADYELPPDAMLITLGKNGGTANLPFFGGLVMGNWVSKSVKSKGLFIENRWADLGLTAPKA